MMSEKVGKRILLWQVLITLDNSKI